MIQIIIIIIINGMEVNPIKKYKHTIPESLKILADYYYILFDLL